MPRMLDDTLLADLARRWQQHAPSAIGMLQPGRSDGEIRATLRPLNVDLPEEVVTWFRWQDGTQPEAVLLGRSFNSVQRTVEATEMMYRADEELPRDWLLVMDDWPYVVVDCQGGATAPAPVWHFDYDSDFPRRPAFASIGEMVATWIELIDDGLLRWRPDEGGWVLDTDAPDAVVERLRGVPTA
jgi:hypothetical protein